MSLWAVFEFVRIQVIKTHFAKPRTGRVIFGRPFVKRFALCYQTIVLSVCPVCDVAVLSNGWIDHDATWYGGRPQSRRHCVWWGLSSPPPKNGHSPQFSAHVYCGQTDADAHLSYCWALVTLHWSQGRCTERCTLHSQRIIVIILLKCR